jgi:chromosome segregation ATPase
MSTPMIRGELREELTKLRQELQQALAPLATKVELEIWGGALLARIQSDKQELTERIEFSEQRLIAELARYAKAFQESTISMIAVIDEKYADLPSRVGRLEAEVFAPRRR